jgi:predicted transcriptional regulator
MDKIFSARVDEAVIHRIGSLARRLHTSKKKVIEDAVTSYAKQVDRDEESDVFDETSGAWNRDESPEQTVDRARGAFRESMERHQG